MAENKSTKEEAETQPTWPRMKLLHRRPRQQTETTAVGPSMSSMVVEVSDSMRNFLSWSKLAGRRDSRASDGSSILEEGDTESKGDLWETIGRQFSFLKGPSPPETEHYIILTSPPPHIDRRSYFIQNAAEQTELRGKGRNGRRRRARERREPDKQRLQKSCESRYQDPPFK